MDLPAEGPEGASKVLTNEDWGPKGERREAYLFSRGLMTQSLLRLGMSAEEGLKVAAGIQNDLEGRGVDSISRSGLHEMVLSRLEGLGPEEARYSDRLRYLEEEGGALVVLIGGTTGSGKTTVAAKVAQRLSIEHVVGTDSLREALRTAIPPGVSPALHRSSYDAHSVLSGFAEEDAKLQRMGFLEHARPVATGINGLLGRVRQEEIRIVVEGIHLVPSLVEKAYRGAQDVIVAVVNVPDEEEHRQRFVRGSRRESRRDSASRYLENFPAIRQIHDFLVEDASKYGLPVIDSEDLEAAASEIIERLWRRVLADGG